MVRTTDVLEFGGVHTGTQKIIGYEQLFCTNRDSLLALMLDESGYGRRMEQQWNQNTLQYLPDLTFC